MKPIKVYLDDPEIKLLKLKAESLGIDGRGWLSHFMRLIARKDFAILDDNLKNVLKLFVLQ